MKLQINQIKKIKVNSLIRSLISTQIYDKILSQEIGYRAWRSICNQVENQIREEVFIKIRNQLRQQPLG